MLKRERPVEELLTFKARELPISGLLCLLIKKGRTGVGLGKEKKAVGF